MDESATLALELDSLRTEFEMKGQNIEAIRGISLRIERGETLGLVGESGSGKSVTSLAIMGLLAGNAKVEADKIAVIGRDIAAASKADIRALRGDKMAMIFQEPGVALNPVYRVGDQIVEAARVHRKISKKEAKTLAIELMREVGIDQPEDRFVSYPHQLSGGQKQRVMIAMALSGDPELLIADEPTTALDVTIQKQILELLAELQRTRQMAILFISHDLAVIADIADRVAVMFRGEIVEQGSVEDIFATPQHPYTKGLLACRPSLATKLRRLPTVADFLALEKGGEEELESRLMRGRGLLLHPKSVLSELGEAADAKYLGNDAEFVDEDKTPLLRVRDLHVSYSKPGKLWRKDEFKAVDGVSFDLYRGQTLGLVGESGCGKTTTGRALLRLVDIAAGSIEFDGVDMRALGGEDLRRFRRRVQIILQDPNSSLNPRMTVGNAILEGMIAHDIGDSSSRRDRAISLLREVGLEAEHYDRYPHEFSGGQRQRIGIARALAVEPELIVCDESVAALDVSVQAQVLNLLKDLAEKRGVSYLFISHDLSVVKFMADMIAVMHAGKIVEFGSAERVYREPQMDYTRRLIASIPGT